MAAMAPPAPAVDDHTRWLWTDKGARLLTGHRWTYAEDTLSAESALRRGILSRGLPATVYLDNGSSFVSKQLLRALAVLGVRLGTFAALDQRVTLRYALAPMSGDETSSYVSHHLALCGRPDTLFSDDALSSIHQAGRGLPRAVNNLARQALVAAYANRSAIVDEKAARQAITEMDAE